MPLIASRLIERMTPDEMTRAKVVESVLPALREAASQADAEARFHLPHVTTFAQAGLLGLIVPREFGGMGGGLPQHGPCLFFSLQQRQPWVIAFRRARGRAF